MVQHPDPDDLTLLAMGEPIDLAVDEHLAECGQCRAEVQAMRCTVELAELSNYGGGTRQPAEHIWNAIVAELRLGATQNTNGSAHPTQAGTATEWNPEHGSHGLAFWQRNTGIPSAPEI